MLNLPNVLKIPAFAILIAFATVPAVAGDYGHLYCDDTGYRCYRVGRDNEDIFHRRDLYRSDYFRRDFDRDRLHEVCDPDGDRCYASRRHYWDFHEYYRRHGYRWED